MSKIDDTPAFARGQDSWGSVQNGMTLRDWFAGQALAGVWAGRESDFHGIAYPGADCVASAAYRIADAMLKARNETNDT